MRKSMILFMVLTGLAFMMVSCDKDKDDDKIDTKILNLDIKGLEDLGNDYAYEGWIMVDGTPLSTGTFNVDGNGGLSKSQFELNPENLDKATAFILTIEPSPDNDASPSAVHLMAGNFSGSSANLTVDHGAAIGTNFSNASGKYILATPTDGNTTTNEKSGVWWLDPANGPGRGLELPELAKGWQYEGWAVINDIPVSTGKFSSVTSADASSVYSGSEADGPPFPGEDFLVNAPAGLTFPLDLSGAKIVISVEPDPDNGPGPFLLKPLMSDVANPATEHMLYNMKNNAAESNPTGTVTR